MDIEKIFDSFSKNSIFTNKNVLQESYTPENIPHREEQISMMAKILAPALRSEKPSNLFIYGKTGTGKTLSMQYIKQRLIERALKLGTKLSIEYINCKLRNVADTEYRIIAELARKLGKEVPATGLPTQEVYRTFVDILEKKNVMLLIVLDEIDQAVKKIADNFLYNLTRLNSEIKNSKIVLIGISNDLTFLDSIDPRVKSSLSEEEIVFPPYNAEQLADILLERSKKAFKKGVICAGVIEKCAAYAAREHGDSRRALDLLRIAAELAEREGKKKLTIEYIDKANEKMERDKILDIIETQPKQFKLVLFTIIELSKRNAKIFTSEIYDFYQELCKQEKIEVLTQRRVSDIIAEFDMLGLINARVISKGRYGRTREIKLMIPKGIEEKARKFLIA